ncbi:MAG TPA: hypothetical protein ENJ28_08925 [Gammaproteobacteria bacterium]|nr:hypothetical protein [Gammaproteobacteria bacterium]
MSSYSSAPQKIIEAITAPLGFFVLALLIVEAFLATVLVGAELTAGDKTTGMWLGVGLFILVTVAVFILVWFKPQHLTFDKEAHLIESGKIPFGSDEESIEPEERFSSKRSKAKGEEQ